MSNNEFNPNSYDAVLARILEKQDEIKTQVSEKCAEDREAFKQIMAKQDVTNGRVNRLEEWRSTSRAKKAVVWAAIMAISNFIGWAVSNQFLSVRTSAASSEVRVYK